jgi:hypothetical protein
VPARLCDNVAPQHGGSKRREFDGLEMTIRHAIFVFLKEDAGYRCTKVLPKRTLL